ncbi:RidA family protein [Blastomonas sp.]|uniref:RidA family protein n=1 Tax=Blastomonas sp. TaxID=1909299 RepID=UPI00262D7B50|nr:RidA family protein [Blastomonas sp.]MDM7955650.1 RidA family protein [Blastomonas sp.]
MIRSILLSAAVLCACPQALAQVQADQPPAGTVERHLNPAPSIILDSVTIPSGAEILMLSGQIADPIDPASTNSLAAFGDTRTQTISTLRKIEAALGRRGYALSDVVKLTVFVVADPRLEGRMDFAGFNAGYREFFGTAANPNLVARSTVQVAGLAGPHYLIEIEAIAAKAR